MAPRLAIACDGIEGDEHLTHDGDEGDLSGALVLVDEALMELSHDGVVPNGAARCVEQDRTDAWPAVPGGGAVVRRAALLGVRCEADEGGDLLAGAAAEFGQLAEEGEDRDGSDAFEAAQGLGDGSEWRVRGEVGVQLALDRVHGLLEGEGDSVQRALDGGLDGGCRPAAFGVQHGDELTAARHQVAPSCRSAACPSGGSLRDGLVGFDEWLQAASRHFLLGELGQQTGIEGIGLGFPAAAGPEGDHLIGDGRGRTRCQLRPGSGTRSAHSCRSARRRPG